MFIAQSLTFSCLQHLESGIWWRSSVVGRPNVSFTTESKSLCALESVISAYNSLSHWLSFIALSHGMGSFICSVQKNYGDFICLSSVFNHIQMASNDFKSIPLRPSPFLQSSIFVRFHHLEIGAPEHLWEREEKEMFMFILSLNFMAFITQSCVKLRETQLAWTLEPSVQPAQDIGSWLFTKQTILSGSPKPGAGTSVNH